MNATDLQAEIERLRAENEKLKRTPTTNGMRVSEKGAMSLYGLGRFPITLYASQWRIVCALVPKILAFLDANKDKLKEKPEKTK